MRIVVTGASGNLGTALLRRLAADGGHDVVGVVRRPPQQVAPYADVDWRAVDLTSADVAEGLDAAFVGAEVVVHLAWGFQPARDTRYLERLGVGGSTAVLRAATRAGVDHLVQASSVGAYTPAPGRVVDETFSTTGTATSPYSRHKVAVERLVDAHDARGGGPVVTRLRPGFVLQRDAASALLRYGASGWLPSSVLRMVPVLPMDRSVALPIIHADDVADAIVRVMRRRPGGAFNLMGEPVVGAAHLAAALGARHVHVPSVVLAGALRASWAAHLHPLDPSWLDLAFSVPLMDTRRAREELGWAPSVTTDRALREAIDAMADSAGTDSPALRPRSVTADLRSLVRSGPVSRRRRT